MNCDRKLAWIVRIDDILPIENADAIEVTVIGGWKVVTRKGEYTVGDLAVYVSLDSWVPHNLAPFLSKGKEPRVYNGVEGERIRSIRLRGQISQGLLLPVQYGTGGYPYILDTKGAQFVVCEGDDVSAVLGLQKWEKPMDASLRGMIKGNFPSFLKKTNQERIQNFSKAEFEYIKNHKWYVEEKLEGSSMTVYVNNGETGVCSRNLDLKETDDSAFWIANRKYGITDALLDLWNKTGVNLAIQGELVGGKIQGNIYKLQGYQFRVFDVYLIDDGRYMGLDEQTELFDRLACELDFVPILDENAFLMTATMDEIIDLAEGKSKLNPQQEREGIVVKRLDGVQSFKVISNKYLLKTGG
jgi:RNA ligase (TIGR02306 family)